MSSLNMLIKLLNLLPCLMPIFLLRDIRLFILSERHTDLHCIVHTGHAFIVLYSSPPTRSCKVREELFHSRHVLVFEKDFVSNQQAVYKGVRFAAPSCLS